MKRKKYFKNNVKLLQGGPDEHFESITFEEFMDWKIAGWQIPSSVYCIVRDYNKRTGKIKEYVYQRPDHAEKKLNNLMLKGDSEITITTDNQVTILRPEEDYDD